MVRSLIIALALVSVTEFIMVTLRLFHFIELDWVYVFSPVWGFWLVQLFVFPVAVLVYLDDISERLYRRGGH